MQSNNSLIERKIKRFFFDWNSIVSIDFLKRFLSLFLESLLIIEKMMEKKMKLLKVGVSLIIILLAAISNVPLASAGNAIIENDLTNLPNSTVLPAEPFITINPISDHTLGDVFIINGTTNLPISKQITMSIESIKYIKQTHPKSDLGPPLDEYAHIENISVSPSLVGTNQWSINITEITKKLKSGDYLVQVDSDVNEQCNVTGCHIPDVSTTAVFTLFLANNSIELNNVQTPIQSASQSLTKINTTAVPPTTQSPPFLLASPISVLLLIIVLRSSKRKRD